MCESGVSQTERAKGVRCLDAQRHEWDGRVVVVHVQNAQQFRRTNQDQRRQFHQDQKSIQQRKSLLMTTKFQIVCIGNETNILLSKKCGGRRLRLALGWI